MTKEPCLAADETALMTRPEVEAAVAAVRAARARLAGQAGKEPSFSKGGRDLVTAADIAAEDAIRGELLQRFPDYPIVGEERGGAPPSTSTPHWLVDPLCGTRPFASGLPTYCTNVALVEGDAVTLAAVTDSTNGRIYVATRGRGAWGLASGEPLRIQASERSNVLWVDPGRLQRGPWTAHTAAFLRTALLSDRWYIWMLGTTLNFVHLAGGGIAGTVFFTAPHPLHSAAGCLLASEAGAVLTDLAGTPWSLRSDSFVGAATPTLHDVLLTMATEAVANSGE
jgi:myo-inositol-1(or 4)-monophosphatase